MPDDDALRRAVDELTLRDHFASVALAALVQSRPSGTDQGVLVLEAYDLAAAMLAERQRRADAD